MTRDARGRLTLFNVRKIGNTGVLVGIVWAALLQPTSAHSASAPGKYVNVEGGEIYYEECGSGDEALVLVHDGVVDSAVWDDVWPVFCKKFHSIRYDRRGYGHSPEATSWYTETDDLFALLQQLKVHHVMLVGSSHGGALSIEFTLEHPNLIEQLVLVRDEHREVPTRDHVYGRHCECNHKVQCEH